jgi:hypothetical protein
VNQIKSKSNWVLRALYDPRRRGRAPTTHRCDARDVRGSRRAVASTRASRGVSGDALLSAVKEEGVGAPVDARDGGDITGICV